MRALLLILSFFSFCSFGQLSLEIGARKQLESFQSDSIADFVLPSMGENFFNDYYSIGIQYQKEKWVYGVDLSLLYKDYSLEHSKEDGAQYYYNVRVESSSLGIRPSTSYILTEGDFSLLVGGYLQTDILLYERESEHYRYSAFQAYSPGGAPYIWASEKTDPFDAVRSKYVHVILGLSVEPRINLGRIYLSPQLNVGFTSRRKLVADPTIVSEGPQMVEEELLVFGAINLEYGFKIGFRLNYKDDTVINHPPM